jgi:hypothetical protein
VKTVWFDELPPYTVRSFTYSNEQVRADQVPRVIVCNINLEDRSFNWFVLRNHITMHGAKNLNYKSSINFSMIILFVPFVSWCDLPHFSFILRYFFCLLLVGLLQYMFTRCVCKWPHECSASTSVIRCWMIIVIVIFVIHFTPLWKTANGRARSGEGK